MENHLLRIIPLLIAISFAYGNQSLRGTSLFQFFVLADVQTPQPVSQNDLSNDSLALAKKWKEINENLAHALFRMDYFTPVYAFTIINGDITESGKSSMWDWFSAVYKPVPTATIGLGDLDYERNINTCSEKEFVGLDGCAIKSVSVLKERIDRYKKIYSGDFRVDYNERESLSEGSLSYSWDWGDVHFVQLQNYPTYTVEIKNGSQTYHNITPSLSWLAYNLNMARSRGKKDIIINFHQFQGFSKHAKEKDRLFFKALMGVYKPRAVFLGHTHNFRRYRNEDFFADTTVYETGAAFRGLFHSVEFFNDKLITREAGIVDGKLKWYGKFTEAPPSHLPQCFVPVKRRIDLDDEPNPGSIFASPLHLDGGEWRIYNSHSKKFLASNEHGVLLMSYHDTKNVSFKWSITQTDFNPEYWGKFHFQSKSSGLILATDKCGKLSLKKMQNSSDGFDFFELWKFIKTEDHELMIINKGTDCLLDLTDDGTVYTNHAFDVDDRKKSWQIMHPDKSEPLENIRYFKLLKMDGSHYEHIPAGNDSNEYWEFLSFHNIRSIPPCIGW